jgi:pimeloyl-ACP methyl ester carboxylesterase
MPRFPTPQGYIHYEIHGPAQAPSLTLLHNFMSSGRTAWGPMLERLSEHYRILLPDSPGHGRSQGYPAGFHHRAMAEQLADLMHDEGAQSGHLAGASSGGMIAQLMVHHGLVTPASLTLVSTTYSNDSKRTGSHREVTPENFRAGSRWLEATARIHDPHHGEGYFGREILAGYRSLGPAETIDLSLGDLAGWRFPVCIIHGREDEFFPPVIAQQMADALPNARLHLLQGEPHALIFRRARAVSNLLLDFLEEVSSPSPTPHTERLAG